MFGPCTRAYTRYEGRGFPVENPIKRQVIGDRNKLTFDANGSLTLYIQNKSPGATRNRTGYPRLKEPSR